MLGVYYRIDPKAIVTTPLEEMLKNGKKSKGRDIAEVITIGPPLIHSGTDHD